MKLTGAEIWLECLKEQNVDTIFGYPGGAVLNIYDALAKHTHEIRHILPSHEQGAAHAADGYARASGKVGVCLATSGPGATNLVTGIATAYMDSVPMVAFTGNVGSPLLGKDSFQEVDITGITMPITKHNFMVKDVNQLAHTIRRAFQIAQEGRPGPVLVDIPKDVTVNTAEYEPQPPLPVQRSKKSIPDHVMEQAAELVQGSKRPFIYAGGGVILADAMDELVEFAELLHAPVSCTLMGLGGFPSTHPQFCGMIGMHGTKTSNVAATQCDVLIAVGARFSDRVVSNVKRFAPDAKILHIDVDPAEINKNIPSYYHVIGDAKKVLRLLLDRLAGRELQPKEEWVTELKQWQKTYPLTYPKNNGLKPQYIMERIYAVTAGDAVITTEVGQNQIWAAQFYKYTQPRTWISSGGLGTMGYGLGASIGAQIGRPDKRVFNIAGDGSFRMNCNELATAVEYELPIIVVILNNRSLGMVRQWQDLFYDRRFSQTTIDRTTDFVKLAEAYGAVGLRLERTEDVDDVLKQALAANRPVVIDCNINPNDKVFPMVPPGAAIADIITEE